MDRYVFRFKTPYKTELQRMKTSLENTQDRMDTAESRISIIEQKLIQSERQNQEQDQCLKYAITTMDDLENRNRWNNIRVRGLPAE